MLNKQRFNNLIISNKKKIQQGRIQVINKLVKKLKTLKSLLEKHPDNLKYKERVRKRVEILDFLKKLKCADAIKKVLMLENDPQFVITNGLSSSEEVAMALLALNKSIKMFIQVLKEQLDLSDTDLEWREELIKPSKRLSKIQRTEEKRKKRKHAKEQKAIGRKRLEWIKENNQHLPEPLGSSATGNWNVETVESDDDSSNVSMNSVVVTSTKNSNETYDANDEIVNVVLDTKNITKLKNVKSSVLPNISDEKTSMKRKVREKKSMTNQNNLDVKISSKESLKKSAPKKTAIKEETEPIVSYVRDPFFITESGEDYLATTVSVPLESSGNADPPEEKNWFGTDTMKRETTADPKRVREKNFKRNTSKYTNENKDNKSLHPSWVAKQKLKPVITSFQGKKIIFEDENTTFQNHSTLENNTASNQNDQNNLHPSWAAKQKLKPVITAFQGKKISFEDFDED